MTNFAKFGWPGASEYKTWFRKNCADVLLRTIHNFSALWHFYFLALCLFRFLICSRHFWRIFRKLEGPGYRKIKRDYEKKLQFYFWGPYPNFPRYYILNFRFSLFSLHPNLRVIIEKSCMMNRYDCYEERVTLYERSVFRDIYTLLSL